MGSTGLGSVKKVSGSRPGTHAFWPSAPGEEGWLAREEQRCVSVCTEFWQVNYERNSQVYWFHFKVEQFIANRDCSLIIKREHAFNFY